MVTLIPILVYWIYWPSLDGPFLWDDDQTILANPAIVHGDWRAALQSMWRGLLIATFANQVRRSGLVTRPLHIGNVGIHIINSALMIGLARTLGFSIIQSECLGLLFACHPLAVSSVASISGRSSSLMGAFWIAALWAHFAGYPIIALVSAVLAIWAREDATVLLATLAALSHSFYGLLYLFPLVYGFQQRYKAHIQHRLFNLRTQTVEPGLHDKARPQPEYGTAVIAESLWRLLGWAFGFGHYFDYELPRWTIKRFSMALWLMPYLILLCLEARNFLVRDALIIILINPWIVSALIPNKDPILEHRFYSTIPGLILLAGTVGQVTSFWFFLPAILLMTFRSRELASVWASALALWGHMYRDGKSISPLVRLNLGNAYFQNGERTKAITIWKEAVQLCPHAVSARCNLATAAQMEGRGPEAKQLWEQVLVDWPKHSTTLLNLGAIYRMEGSVPKAEQCYRDAIQYDGSQHKAYGELGGILASTGRADEAVKMFAAASQQRPDITMYTYNQIVLNIRLGNVAAAAECVKRLPQQ